MSTNSRESSSIADMRQKQEKPLKPEDIQNNILLAYDRIKRQIANDYCRNIAVVDDQIYEANTRTVHERFFSLYEECQRVGILCSFIHYKGKDVEKDIESINDAVRLSEQADIIVLDWRMGNPECIIPQIGTTEPGDHSHAFEILRKLMSNKSLRFVAIYTREGYEETCSHLENELGLSQLDILNQDSVETLSDDTFETGPPEPKLDAIYHYENRFFVTVKQYIGDAVPSAKELLVLIHDLLPRIFPDHLHWAGLELATRVRSILLQLLGSIPVATDAALYHQLLFQTDGEMAPAVSSILLDELVFRFASSPLESLSDDYLFETLRPKMIALCNDTEAIKRLVSTMSPEWENLLTLSASMQKAGQNPTVAQKKRLDIVKNIDSVKSWWPKISRETARLAAQKGVRDNDFFPHDPEGSGTCEVASSYIEAALLRAGISVDYAAWAKLTESVISPVDKNQLWTGYVLKQKRSTIDVLLSDPGANIPESQRTESNDIGVETVNSEQKVEPDNFTFIQEEGKIKSIKLPAEENPWPEWMLCITPGCDCYRPKQERYIFIGGSSKSKDINSTISGENFIETFVGSEEVIWDAMNLIVVVDPLKKKKSNSKVPDLEVVGALRSSFTNMIIHKVWSYQSRVAVDSSELYRQRRMVVKKKASRKP